jgi:hypothetical protein
MLDDDCGGGSIAGNDAECTCAATCCYGKEGHGRDEILFSQLLCFGGIFYLEVFHPSFLKFLHHQQTLNSYVLEYITKNIIITMARSKQQARKSKGVGGGGGGGGNNNNSGGEAIVPGIKASPIKRGGRGSKAARPRRVMMKRGLRRERRQRLRLMEIHHTAR